MRTFLLKVTSPVGGSVHVGLLILRVFVGAMMLTHGMAKLLTFSELSLVFPDPLGVGSTMSLLLLLGSEVVCSILLMCGILTRLVVLPSIFGLLVAVFAIHGGDAFAVKELAWLYMGVYVALFFTGAGRYSVDDLIFSRLQAKEADAIWMETKKETL